MKFFLTILAGGKSKRFGSNKALYQYKGISLLSHLIKQIPKLIHLPDVLFISLHNKDQFQEIIPILYEELSILKKDSDNWELIFNDNEENIKIPMIFVYDSVKQNLVNIHAAILGFSSIFQKISNGYVQIIPCDTPFFDLNIVDTFYSIIQKSNMEIDALIPRWKNGFIEPLNSVYKVESFKERVKNNIQKRIFRISKLFGNDLKLYYYNIEQKLASGDPSFNSFQNINTLSDISKNSNIIEIINEK